MTLEEAVALCRRTFPDKHVRIEVTCTGRIGLSDDVRAKARAELEALRANRFFPRREEEYPDDMTLGEKRARHAIEWEKYEEDRRRLAELEAIGFAFTYRVAIGRPHEFDFALNSPAFSLEEALVRAGVDPLRTREMPR